MDTKVNLSKSERMRRERVLQDGIASCAIEGLLLGEEDKREVQRLYQLCSTSDEMVKRLILKTK